MFQGLIFALPALRNSMPNAPGFGIGLDWIAFYWGERALSCACAARVLLHTLSHSSCVFAFVGALHACVQAKRWLSLASLLACSSATPLPHNAKQTPDHLPLSTLFALSCNFRYIKDQRPEKSNGITWLGDVFCPPLPPSLPSNVVAAAKNS